MSEAVQTLFDVLQGGTFDITKSRCLFLNARYHSALTDNVVLQQHFKPYADELTAAGFMSLPDIPDDPQSFDLVAIMLPKNADEARFFIALGLRMAKTGGLLVCCAGNKAGGKRIKKMLQDFGLGNVQDYTKHKARCAWANVDAPDEKAVSLALQKGGAQDIIGGEYVSQPGLFGWDKIDKGSKLLAQYVPDDLSGKGADFGCGYGYLSDRVLSKAKKIEGLVCIDADYRAFGVCQQNLENHGCYKEFVWADLTKGKIAEDLDFIVMNPPFHEGSKADYAVGQRFIETAQRSLRKGGDLYMVANAHLPYEDILSKTFGSVEKLFEGQGFKIYHAR